jgi:hypothetical protein
MGNPPIPPWVATRQSGTESVDHLISRKWSEEWVIMGVVSSGSNRADADGGDIEGVNDELEHLAEDLSGVIVRETASRLLF